MKKKSKGQPRDSRLRQIKCYDNKISLGPPGPHFFYICRILFLSCPARLSSLVDAPPCSLPTNETPVGTAMPSCCFPLRVTYSKRTRSFSKSFKWTNGQWSSSGSESHLVLLWLFPHTKKRETVQRRLLRSDENVHPMTEPLGDFFFLTFGLS